MQTITAIIFVVIEKKQTFSFPQNIMHGFFVNTFFVYLEIVQLLPLECKLEVKIKQVYTIQSVI